MIKTVNRCNIALKASNGGCFTFAAFWSRHLRGRLFVCAFVSTHGPRCCTPCCTQAAAADTLHQHGTVFAGTPGAPRAPVPVLVGRAGFAARPASHTSNTAPCRCRLRKGKRYNPRHRGLFCVAPLRFPPLVTAYSSHIDFFPHHQNGVEHSANAGAEDVGFGHGWASFLVTGGCRR